MTRQKPTFHEWRETVHTLLETRDMPLTDDNMLLNVSRYNRVMHQLALKPKARTRFKAETRKQEFEEWFTTHGYVLVCIDGEYVAQRKE